jgi:hypothetical protein
VAGVSRCGAGTRRATFAAWEQGVAILGRYDKCLRTDYAFAGHHVGHHATK